MNIDTLEAVQLGGIPQWIRIRGTDAANPVLLLMQQGPGLPLLNEVRRFNRLLALEETFTVVYWDQRGCGRTLRASGVDLTVDRMVADTVSLLELLRDRFGGPPFVAGFSFGATFAALAAVERPDLIAALVGVGMDIDVAAAEQSTYDFVLAAARDRGNRRAIRQLEAIGAPPHLTAEQFSTRVRWAIDFGGVVTGESYGSLLRGTLARLLRSPDYSVADVIRTLRGITATQAALLPRIAGVDLVATMPRLDVPVVLVQGRLDRVAPGELTQRFHDSLTAPSKQLVWFEKSAHSPHFEEPEKFRGLLMDLRASHGSRSG